jgi:hypothetical protein
MIYGVAAVLHNADYLSVAKGATNTYLNDPFYYLFTCVMETCLLLQRNERIHEKIDFVFDMANKPAWEIDKIFKGMMFCVPDDIKALDLVHNPPIFRDDKEFVALQAADLAAGYIRDYFERSEVDKNAKPDAVMEKLAERNVKFATTEHDARILKFLVEGTLFTQAAIQNGPPEKALDRFLGVKSAVEEMARKARAENER